MSLLKVLSLAEDLNLECLVHMKIGGCVKGNIMGVTWRLDSHNSFIILKKSNFPSRISDMKIYLTAILKVECEDLDTILSSKLYALVVGEEG